MRTTSFSQTQVILPRRNKETKEGALTVDMFIYFHVSSHLELTYSAIFCVLATSLNPHPPNSYHLDESPARRTDRYTGRHSSSSKQLVAVDTRGLLEREHPQTYSQHSVTMHVRDKGLRSMKMYHPGTWFPWLTFFVENTPQPPRSILQNLSFSPSLSVPRSFSTPFCRVILHALTPFRIAPKA